MNALGRKVTLHWYYTGSTCAVTALGSAVTRKFTGMFASVNAKVRDIGKNSTAPAPKES